MSSEKIIQTRNGLSYGSITAIDVNLKNERIVIANSTGELFVFNLLSYL